jgi:hypothetical protein
MDRGPTVGHLAPASGGEDPTDATVRAEERRRLARELYDIVAHHLANVALRTMGRLDTADLGGLQHVLADVNRATGSALVELRLLAHVLEDDPAVLRPFDGVGELTSRLVPSAAAERWHRRLADHGRTAAYQVPVAADLLPLSVQSTLARIFEAVGETALVHAAPGACCTLAIEVGVTEVRVSSRTELPLAPPAHQQGGDPERELHRSLRGLRERVDLSHGRLEAAVQTQEDRKREWVVTVVLPLV